MPIAPTAVDHSQVIGTCASCHNGIIASGKSATHIPTSNTCDACHQPGPVSWVPVAVIAVDHNHTLGACVVCHDGTIASGKSATHIPSLDSCENCHLPGPIPWAPILAAAVDHTQVVGACFDCHNGTVASGKGVRHITTSNLCDSCHQSGPTPCAHDKPGQRIHRR